MKSDDKKTMLVIELAEIQNRRILAIMKIVNRDKVLTNTELDKILDKEKLKFEMHLFKLKYLNKN